jgi:organic hydroperoxide reductase OsmC/OhrA
VTSGDFTFAVDEPESAGGTGTAPMPTEYLLGAAASCYALALQWAATRQGVDLPDLSVTAVGEYDGASFSEIRLIVESTLPRERLEPLLEPAHKVCYVSNSLSRRPVVEIAED